MTTRRPVLAPALLVSTILALAMFGSARAQGPKLNVKLGLWEATTVIQTTGAPPVDMSKMTPEQRQRFETALENSRKRGATPHTTRTCLNAEKLEKGPFEGKDSEACKREVVTSSSTTYDVKFVCHDEQVGSTSGEWHFEALTPELVKGTGTISMERAGQKMESTSTMTAKWVGAVCGDVR